MNELCRKKTGMTIEQKARSIASSFGMEGMDFNSECTEMVKGILTGEILVSDAIVRLNEKYNVTEISDISAIEETLFLMSVPSMAESIVEGGKTPLEECSTEEEVEN